MHNYVRKVNNLVWHNICTLLSENICVFTMHLDVYFWNKPSFVLMVWHLTAVGIDNRDEIEKHETPVIN